MDEKVEQRVQVLIEDALERFSEAKAHQIGFAAMYAEKAHQNQSRKDGEPFIMHPLRVAQRLVRLNDKRVDDVTIIAALLHDVVEDTNKTLDTIHMQFGRDVAKIVDSLTKRRKEDREQEDAEFTQQILDAVRKDARVGLIKLSDQIDNSQDMSVYSTERKEYRLSSLEETWIPLAEELNIPNFKKELESAHQKNQE